MATAEARSFKQSQTKIHGEIMIKNYSLPTIAITVSILITACGGGGSSGPENGRKNAYEASDVFAEPAGPLCAEKINDQSLQVEYCKEPTASSATPQQLLQALTNSAHPYVEFKGTGIELALTLNAINYQNLESRRLLLQAARKHDGQRFLDLDQDLTADHTRVYTADQGTISALNRDIYPEVFQMAHSVPYGASSSLVTGLSFDRQAWHAIVGMRTDWLTAPSGNSVRFHGHVLVMASDGHDVSESRLTTESTSKVTGQCPIQVDLDVKTGDLNLVNLTVTCVDGETGALMTFTMPKLTLRSRASVVEKVLTGSAVVASLQHVPNEVMLVDESIGSITGGVYGDQAKVLIVHGISSKAYFLLAARRID